MNILREGNGSNKKEINYKEKINKKLKAEKNTDDDTVDSKNLYGNIPKEAYRLVEEILTYVYALEKKSNIE